MSNSPLVSYTKLSPHYSAMSNKKNKKITIHHMAGNLSVETCGNVFQTRQASSNYGIGSDGRIGMYVEEHNRSWASSNRANDEQAVTIEVANDGGSPNWHVGDKALASLIELCVDICKRNGIEKLVYTGDSSGNLTKHSMFAATACPGPYLGGKFTWIAEEVNKRLGADTPSEAKPASDSSSNSILRRGSSGAQVKELQEKLIYIGYSCGRYGADGDFGSATETAVKEFQHNAGIDDDGVVGAITSDILNKVYSFAKSYSFENFVRDVQKAIGAKVDGIPGSETLSKTVTISNKANSTHAVVKAVQKRLYALGYATVGTADGIAGSKFEIALCEYQKDHDCYSDGEATAQKTTWKRLLKLG